MNIYKTLFAWIIILISAELSFAQVGRNELPLDTVPIGGQQEENKLNRMQNKDQLSREIISLRDSVDQAITKLNKRGDEFKTNVGDASRDRYKNAMHELNNSRRDLDKALGELSGSKEWNADISSRVSKVVGRVRSIYQNVKADFLQ